MSLFKDRIGPAIAEYLAGRAEEEMAPYRKSVVEQARGRVLEIGAGTGFNVRHYPADVEEIVITEPGEALLRRAERRAASGGRNVTSLSAPAERLPFEDASFDTVVSSFVLQLVPSRTAALAELRRVLRPGGTLAYVTWLADRTTCRSSRRVALCSVRDQDEALAEVRRVLKPGGRFLFLEHVRADDPKSARRQDRLNRLWRVVAMGCNANRATLGRIEAAGFDVEEVRHGELPKSPPLIRPMILGRAVAPRA